MTYSQGTKTPTRLSIRQPLQRHKRHKNWSMHRHVLLVATVLILVFCGVLLSLRCIFKDNHENKSKYRNDITSEKPQFESLELSQCSAVCASKDCIKTAALMLKMMDPTVDPCEDFYSFACGGYDKVVMGSKRKEYVINDMGQEILKPLQNMIEMLPRSVPENTPGSSFTKIRKFYDSCMNIRSSEEMAIPTALRYLEYFGVRNWPDLNNNYNFTDPDIDEALVRLSLYHSFLFFTLNTFQDEDEDVETSSGSAAGESGTEFKVKVPFLYSQILHSDGHLHDETKNMIKATMEYFQLPESVSKEIIEDVTSFDLGIYNITQETNLRKEQCEMNDTISCSSYYYDCTEEDSSHTNRWCKIVGKLLSDCGFTEKYSHIRIILEDGKHFHDLSELIHRSSHRTIAHALALRFFVDNAITMNFYLRRKASYQNAFSNKSPQDMPESPSLYCAAWVSRRLPILMGTAFYSNIYKGETHKEVKEIYLDIQESLISIVEDIPWVDREAKTSTKELLTNIALSGYVYSQYIWNVSATDEFSEKLQITEESFLANDLEAKKFLIITAIRVLDNMTDMEYLTRYPFELDPTIGQLIINFEIGSFLFPLIAVGRSRYSNLGSFGGIIGHELSHALEISLRGHENKSENFERAFEERKKCLSEHYSAYEIDMIGEKVDGNDTFSENLADYFGFRAIFKSLTKYQEKRGYIERLPGLPFDNEQILFVSFAQLWCETNTLDSLKHYMQDNHSPAKQRVWGVYRNFEAFSEAFNCPLGSPMNPVNKCSFEF